MSHIGEWAALLVAICWTISALSFTLAGERVGSLVVNLVRLLIAFVLFVAWGLAVEGEALPFSATPDAWLWLSLSGFAGFFIGDLCLFRAFLLIGPRLGLLIMSLSPPLTALLGWWVLGERLTVMNWVGMTVTLAGVGWVVTETAEPSRAAVTPHTFNLRGGLLALLGSAGQAAGMVLAKLGLPGVKSAAAATQIRLIAGLLCFALLMAALRRMPAVFQAFRDRRAMGILTVGAAAGPFAGVGLMMFAIGHISTGLAQTFVATTPVLIIPFTRLIYGERASPRAVAGAVVAFAGVALLFVR